MACGSNSINCDNVVDTLLSGLTKPQRTTVDGTTVDRGSASDRIALYDKLKAELCMAEDTAANPSTGIRQWLMPGSTTSGLGSYIGAYRGS